MTTSIFSGGFELGGKLYGDLRNNRNAEPMEGLKAGPLYWDSE